MSKDILGRLKDFEEYAEKTGKFHDLDFYVAIRSELDRLRAENEALKADAERFCALFSHIDKSGESPWSAIESVKYGERIDAGEPLIDVIREAIDKHLRGEGE